MRTNLHPEQQGVLFRFLSSTKRVTRLLGAGLLLANLGAQAQTTVFSEDFEGATNSFTTVNGTQPNQWFVGTAGGNGPTTAGTKAAYISNDAGVTNAYTITSTSVTHLYRDVTFPSGTNVLQLGFDWKAAGESTYDYILVQVAPTTFTPVDGTIPSATSVNVLAQINLQPAFGRTTLQVPGNFAGTTQRLIFTWRNDGSGGTQPPATIDNVALTSQVASPISGAFTINDALPTAGTNFHSFTDAAARLSVDGISAATTVTVLGGPYNEQFRLGDVAGTSATSRLTINGGGRTIAFASTTSNQRAVVQLNGTDYTTVNNLIIDATGGTGTSGTYGVGVLLTNAADNDVISNCTINADIASTSSIFTGIAVTGSLTSVTASGNSANNLTLEGNTVNGGYYGITLYGAGTTNLNTGNIIRNNIVRDFYLYGIYVGYQDAPQIIGNEVTRMVRTNSSTFYGVYLFGGSRGAAIEKNRVHDPFGGLTATTTNAAYCLYVTATGTATATNDVVNNLVYNINSNGTIYGVYNSGAPFSRVYNNTIALNDQTATAGTTYGIYSSGATVDVKNNVVSVTRTGTGTKYGLYYTTATTTSNYNDIYVPTGNVGYYQTAYVTLANWQTALSGAFDQNSVSTDPLFVNPSTGNFTPSSVLLNNTGTPLARVTTDILGTTRGALPDMGAYEFTPVAVDLSPVALAGPSATTSCFSGTEPVVVEVRNSGTAVLNFANNPATVTVVVTLPGGTTQTFTTTVTTGTLASGASLNVTLPGTLNMVALGTYSFAVTASVTGDQNASNNVLTPAETRTVVAPVAGTLTPAATPICVSGTAALTLSGAANANTQYQVSTDNVTFTDIAGATGATYTTPVLTSTRYYRVRSTCNATTVYSNVSTITVNNPQITAAPSPLNTCTGGTATLSATVPAGISVRYYTAATGGTLVGTGNPFVTPALTASTTYYAEAFAGSQENVGKATNTGTTTNTAGGLYFTATGPTTIVSVTVYRTPNSAAGTATIHLLPGSTTSTTNALHSVTVPVPANTSSTVEPTVLTLNFVVPAAGNYTLYLGAASPALIRETTASFPYTSPSGLITITNATLAGYYYFFYNWQIGSSCVGGSRTAIQVNVTPGQAASLPTAAATFCANTPYQLSGSIAGSATGGVYTTSGSGTFSPNATTLNATYTPSAADIAAGTVTVTLTPTGPAAGCTSTGQVVLTITSPPQATFSYPSGTYCTGSPVTVAPVLAAGSIAGTFSASGSGLRIDPVTGVINLATSISDGTYTITNSVNTTGACAGSATSTTTFTLIFGLATPTLTAAPQPGGAVRLTATAITGATYQFYLNNVAVGTPTTSNMLLLQSGTQSGSYTVVATSTSGCASRPSTAVTVTVLATQTATLNGVSLLVYPNPTPNGHLTLELRGVNAKASRLSVLNALGQVVHTSTLAPGTEALNLNGLASGVYTVRVQTTDGVLTQRIVRE